MKHSHSYWFFVRIPVWFVFLSLAAVLLIRWIPVRYTPLMLKRELQFRKMDNYHTQQAWVSLECISSDLVKAVIAGEDARFYEHQGFDWAEIQAMWKTHQQDETHLRGCSTISQQTAKNVFSFGSPTWIRKAIEAWLTVLIETIWGKDRILEVYLNVVELGPGIFGVGTASRSYFQTSPDKLTPDEAATLAACLSSPLINQPGKLTARAKARKRIVLERMPQVPYTPVCYRHAVNNIN